MSDAEEKRLALKRFRMGLALVVGSIWIGSAMFNYFPQTWYGAAAIVTCGFAVIIGLFMTMIGGFHLP